MDAGTLRIVTLNCGSLLEPGWPERRDEVVAWLRELEPDVVCLQEVWGDSTTPDSASGIVDAMPEAGWHRHFGGAPFGERLWPDPSMRFGSAVLSRWPIDDAALHRLPLAGSRPEDGGDPWLWDVPWELVHVRTAGLDVFSCHLVAAPRDGRHRLAQALAIDEIVAAATGDRDTAQGSPAQARDGMPAILCGDLNAEPDSDEVRFLTSLTAVDGRTTFWQDAWRVAGDGGPGFTQDWRANPSAAALNVHRKRIDYVFVGDAFRRRDGGGRVLSARLAFHEPRTGVLASDHFGLVVDVRWPGRPGRGSVQGPGDDGGGA